MIKKNEKASEPSFLWFPKQKQKRAPEGGSLPQEKTTNFHEFNTNEPDFIASKGWTNLWKKRYGVRQLTICQEKIPSDSESLLKFTEEIQCFVQNKNLSHSNLQNRQAT